MDEQADGLLVVKQDATLSQGVPRDAAVNFGTYRSFQWHLRTRNSADSEIEDPHRTP